MFLFSQKLWKENIKEDVGNDKGKCCCSVCYTLLSEVSGFLFLRQFLGDVMQLVRKKMFPDKHGRCG